jgi:7-cyano-7-deazaguanine synthase in queuosine biosynthesis
MSTPEVTSAIFLCDGAAVPDHLAARTWTKQGEIWSTGTRAELNLRLDALDTHLRGEVSGIANDLLYIACCCLAADQRVNRGSKQIDVHRHKWRREFTLVLPVSAPKLWNRPDVTGALMKALYFATEDKWTFVFVKQPPRTIWRTMFGKAESRAMRGNPDCVVLFSGGIDSLCATVEGIADFSQRPLALSFRAANQVAHDQDQLIQALQERFSTWRLQHISFASHRYGGSEPDPSQRTRAFVLAALGCAVAESLGIDTVLLADNGYVSINPPISAELAGALASRGTHPLFLRLVNHLVALLFPVPPKVLNPLADRTRAEALEILIRHGCQDLVSRTLTCGKFRSRHQSRAVPHCGICSQCVDRRFAVIQAGLEEIDPASRYVVDIFRQELVGTEAIKVAPMYARFAQQTAVMSPEAILAHVPQLRDCLDPESDDPENDAFELADLLWRHSNEVTAVLGEMVGRYRGELASGTLPERSLLRLVVGGAPNPQFGSEVNSTQNTPGVGAQPTLTRQGKYWHFTFHGEKAVVRHRKGITHLSRLLAAPGKEIDCRVLASGEAKGVDEIARVYDAELSTDTSFDEVLDEDGEDLLRRHVDRLRAERDAGVTADRATAINHEILQIDEHIKRARGLRGRHRAFPDDAERARIAVGKSIRAALAELAPQSSVLFEHLQGSITTGRLVIYEPRPLIRWVVAT